MRYTASMANLEGLRESSRHHQRRWFYVLWAALLLLSLGALLAWETPARSGVAQLDVIVRIAGMPAGTRCKAWVGPVGKARSVAWEELPTQGMEHGEGFEVRGLKASIGYRRWLDDYIPRRTADHLVLRFEAPDWPPRYLPISLAPDWRRGLLRPGQWMRIDLGVTWDGLFQHPVPSGDPGNGTPEG